MPAIQFHVPSSAHAVPATWTPEDGASTSVTGSGVVISGVVISGVVVSGVVVS